MSPIEFKDGIAIRYKKPLLCNPDMCDGCGSNFDLSHALSSKKGRLVTRHHNKIRDAIANVSLLAWNQIRIEPFVRETNSLDDFPALITDIGILSVWLPQVEGLMDVKVVDTDAQSYFDHSLRKVCCVKEEKNVCSSIPGVKGKIFPLVLFC